MAGAIKRNKRETVLYTFAPLMCFVCIYTQSNYTTRSSQRTKHGLKLKRTNEKDSRQSTDNTSCDNRLQNGSQNIVSSHFNTSNRIEFYFFCFLFFAAQIVCHRVFASRTHSLCIVFCCCCLCVSAASGCSSSPLPMIAWTIVVFAVLVIPFSCILNELNSFCGRLWVISYIGWRTNKIVLCRMCGSLI